MILEELKTLLKIDLGDNTQDDLINEFITLSENLTQELCGEAYQENYLYLIKKFLAAHLYTLANNGNISRESIGHASIEYNIALDKNLKNTAFGAIVKELDYKKTLQRDDNKKVEFVIL